MVFDYYHSKSNAKLSSEIVFNKSLTACKLRKKEAREEMRLTEVPDLY